MEIDGHQYESPRDRSVNDPLKEAIDLYLERPEDFEPSPPTDGDLPFTAAQAASMAEWSQDPFDMDWAWVNPEVRKEESINSDSPGE